MFVLDAQESENIVFLDSVDLAHAAHEYALQNYPDQRRGVLNEGALASAMNRPATHHNYENERDILKLAAILWHGVSIAHGYEDGNKRTAFLLMTAFLEANGVELVEDRGFPGRFINDCFQKDLFTIKRLHDFLKPRCRWITEV